MTEDQRAKCHVIIHAASVSGAGVAAGMAQVPFSDIPVLIGIEVTMVISLGAVFGVMVSRSAATSFITAYVGKKVGVAVFKGLIGWVPGLGNAVNAGTAAAMIEVLGWAVASDFDNKDNKWWC